MALRTPAAARWRVASGLAGFALLMLAPLAVAAWADPIELRRPFALEFGVALGFVAFALCALEFALVARQRWVADPFGTDALALFHKHMGLLALGCALAHALLARAGRFELRDFLPYGGSTATRSGAIALDCALLLVGLSLARRRLALGYAAWRATHRLLAIALVAAMLVHALALGRYARAPAVAAVLWATVLGFVALLVRYRALRPLWLWRRPWELLENRDAGGSTRLLVLRPLGHAGLRFEAGQFAWLISGASPLHSEQHPLSFACSAEPARDGRLEFAVKALGDWSREQVPALRPGARLWVDGPFGAFTPEREDWRGLALIAGGIGITPLRSMLLTLRDRRERRPIVLFYAANRPERAVFLGELLALERELALRVVPVFEAPDAGWQGERGFVDAALLGRYLPADLAGWHCFVCGPAPMMDALERELARLGLPAAQIHSERFDMV